MDIEQEIQLINPKEIVKIRLNAAEKYTALPVTVKGAECFCFETFRDNKAYHKNIGAAELGRFLKSEMSGGSNAVIFTSGRTYEFKMTKKGTLLKNAVKSDLDFTPKNTGFTLPFDIPALHDLGLVTKENKPVAAMRDKLVQVQLFTELIYGEIKERKSLKIVDCGCGKAYLSFVLYHYLTFEKNIDVQITGIDLKSDVIKNLNETARRYGYGKMQFICGDIFDADLSGADMLISLHACDKATDYAFFNAIKHGVGIIFAAPCCQKELNAAFDAQTLTILNRYGLIKERLAALFTDAVRASLLTACGYKTKTAEFVPLAHSPKNIMLKAIKSNLSGEVRTAALNEAKTLLNEINSGQELLRLLEQSKLL